MPNKKSFLEDLNENNNVYSNTAKLFSSVDNSKNKAETSEIQANNDNKTNNPPIKPKKALKTKIITFKVTEAEELIIKAKAKEENLAISKFIRKRVLDNE